MRITTQWLKLSKHCNETFLLQQKAIVIIDTIIRYFNLVQKSRGFRRATISKNYFKAESKCRDNFAFLTNYNGITTSFVVIPVKYVFLGRTHSCRIQIIISCIRFKVRHHITIPMFCKDLANLSIPFLHKILEMSFSQFSIYRRLNNILFYTTFAIFRENPI